MNENFVGYCFNKTHNEFRDEKIDEYTFSYKGCWNCDFFCLNEERYMYVEEASLLYGVSQKTIRTWCKNGKIDASLCKRDRFEYGSIGGPNKRWLIEKTKNDKKLKK